VYCAEPDLQNYQCLTRNVRDNELRGLVLPDRVAIASRDGVVSLEQGKTTGGHRVLPQHMEGTRPTSAVEGLTLDSWIDRLGIDPDEVAFVKVDVQGSETHVLGGARRLLQCRHVAWQIEIDLRALRDRGLKDDDLLGPMRDSFTHFVDLSRSVAGERVRSTRDLDEGLKYLSDGSDSRTDVLLFSLGV
jgi:FkbM family methyltransferase